MISLNYLVALLAIVLALQTLLSAGGFNGTAAVFGIIYLVIATLAVFAGPWVERLRP